MLKFVPTDEEACHLLASVKSNEARGETPSEAAQ
jgi:hypothetical protein